MGVTRGHLKTIMKGSGRYHEIRWNVGFSLSDRYNNRPIKITYIPQNPFSPTNGMSSALPHTPLPGLHCLGVLGHQQ
jgi:hypothetical protein